MGMHQSHLNARGHTHARTHASVTPCCTYTNIHMVYVSQWRIRIGSPVCNDVWWHDQKQATQCNEAWLVTKFTRSSTNKNTIPWHIYLVSNFAAITEITFYVIAKVWLLVEMLNPMSDSWWRILWPDYPVCKALSWWGQFQQNCRKLHLQLHLYKMYGDYLEDV